MTYWISLPHVTLTVRAKGGLIVDAAPPVAHWTIGKDPVMVLDYFRRQGARIDWIKNA